MDTLPNEILDCIFTDHNLFQKQECMLVCRRWSQIIRTTSLFSTVIINKNTNLVRLFQTLDANPSYRHQMQKLIVLYNTSLTLSKGKLVEYFPKLRFIHLEDVAIQLGNDLVGHVPVRLSNVGNNGSQLTDFNNWINRIEVIEQHFPPQLLSSGVLFGLKTLVLTLYFYDNVYTDIIAYAPNITSLTMINVRISLANLGLLQIGLKALQSLTLEEVHLMVDKELNDLITESTITALYIIIQNIDDGIIVIWLQYITKNCAFLQDFRFIFPWIGHITPQYEENITNNGLVPLLKNLGSILKHLDINSSFELDTILRTLDIQNHNIQMLRVSMLFNSDWLPFVSVGELGRYIHELTITLYNDSWLKTYDLKEISALKKLKIGRAPRRLYLVMPIFLNDILDSCSNSLESLEIYDFIIDCSSTDTNSSPPKRLAIHGNPITKTVYRFVSYSLPGLDSLIIDKCYMISDGTIMLKDKDFSYLDISINYSGYIIITTLSDGISYNYSLANYEKSDFDTPESSNTKPQSLIKRATLEQTKGSERIATFTCKSIKTLVVNKKIAF